MWAGKVAVIAMGIIIYQENKEGALRERVYPMKENYDIIWKPLL